MLLGLALALFVIWLLAFVVFHVVVGMIHLLIFLAVIALIAHFVRGRGPGAGRPAA
jgi:Family of unknown function (DUF5670)